MKREECYRKVGRVVRLERGGDATRLVRIDEAGQATLSGDRFISASIDQSVAVSELDSSRVERIAAEIESLIEPPLAVERLLVSEGIAAHENLSAEGSVGWEERSERIHVAVVNRRCRARALLDLGDFDAACRELTDVTGALAALEPDRALPSLRSPISGGSALDSFRFQPRVTAALLAALIENVHPHSTRQAVSIRQAAHSAIRCDGKGLSIEELTLVDSKGVQVESWPNWFRPSYRIRPVRMPFHVRLIGPKVASSPSIEVRALLAPIEIDRGLVKLALLAYEGAVTHALAVEIAVGELMRRLHPVGEMETWYPYGAGAWGVAAAI